MKHFLFKLISPRPTFPQDTNDVERKVMLEHVAYWKGLVEKGVAVVFGPVRDPKGVCGVAVVEAVDEEEARALVPNDPVFKARLGPIEVYSMAAGTIARR